MNLETARREQNELLAPLNLSVVGIKPDGNCLFRGVAHQLFRDEERHAEVRAACVEYLRNHKSFYRDFVPGKKIDEHLARMQKLGEWGDHLELQALSELYAMQVAVFSTDAVPTVIYAAEGDPRRIIRLFYNNMVHYDSVVEATPRGAERPSLSAAGRPPCERGERRQIYIRRRNLCRSSGLTLKQIMEKSMAQIEADFSRQTASTMRESEQSNIDEDILRQMLTETAKEPPFDLFSALLAMGYSDAIALECVMNFGPEERDVQKVVNFIAMRAMF